MNIHRERIIQCDSHYGSQTQSVQNSPILTPRARYKGSIRDILIGTSYSCVSKFTKVATYSIFVHNIMVPERSFITPHKINPSYSNRHGTFLKVFLEEIFNLISTLKMHSG